MKQLVLLVLCAGLFACSGSGGSADESSPADESLKPVAGEASSIIDSSSEPTTDTPLQVEAPSQAPSEALPGEHQANTLFMKQSGIAKAMYDGSREENVLTSESASELMASLNLGLFPDKSKIIASTTEAADWVSLPLSSLTDVPLLRAKPVLLNEELISGVLDCAAGGTMQVTSLLLDENGLESALSQSLSDNTVETNTEKSYYHYTIEYNECKDSTASLQYSGDLDVYFSIDSIGNYSFSNLTDQSLGWSGDSFYADMIYSYNNLIVRNDQSSVQINGALSWEDTGACAAGGLKEVNAHMLSLDTGESVYLEDMLIGWRKANSYPCQRELSTATYLKGKLFHSRYGMVSVETPNILYPDDYNWQAAPFAEIELFSAGTKAWMTDVENINLIYPSSHSVRGRQLSFSLFDQDDMEIEAFNVSASMFERGGTLDLNDDDNDGMGNSWEVVGGLDSNNPEDAGIDSDGDGVTNLIEFLSAGDPKLESNGGINNNLRLVYADFYSLYRDGSINFSFDIYGQLVVDMFSVRENYLVLSANVDGMWIDYTSGCEPDEDDISTLRCNSQIGSGFYGYFLPDANGPLELNAVLLDSEFDYIPADNVFTLALDYNEL